MVFTLFKRKHAESVARFGHRRFLLGPRARLGKKDGFLLGREIVGSKVEDKDIEVHDLSLDTRGTDRDLGQDELVLKRYSELLEDQVDELPFFLTPDHTETGALGEHRRRPASQKHYVKTGI